MYERILVPLDGSKLGEKAVPYVDEILCLCAPEKKVQVTLLQVITELTHPLTIPSRGGADKAHRMPPYEAEELEGVISIEYTEAEMEQMKKQAVAYLDKVAEGLKKKGVTVKSSVRFGKDAANEILKAADQMKADLIAISTHGRSGVSRWALGSVADKVMRHSNTPVIMVRAGKVS